MLRCGFIFIYTGGFFCTLNELQTKISTVFASYFGGKSFTHCCLLYLHTCVKPGIKIRRAAFLRLTFMFTYLTISRTMPFSSHEWINRSICQLFYHITTDDDKMYDQDGSRVVGKTAAWKLACAVVILIGVQTCRRWRVEMFSLTSPRDAS